MIDAKDLYEDIALQYDYWLQLALKLIFDKNVDLDWLEDPESIVRIRSVVEKSCISREDFENLFKSVLFGLVHSIFSTFDGATHSAEKGRVYIVNEEGEPLGVNHHTAFTEYLVHTNRPM